MDLLAINWAEVGIKAGQFVLSFSIIVVLMNFHFYTLIFKCSGKILLSFLVFALEKR
jgi:hypothetical protein